jgi:hypothetical protein
MHRVRALHDLCTMSGRRRTPRDAYRRGDGGIAEPIRLI